MKLYSHLFQSTQWVSLLAYVSSSSFGLFLVRVSQKKRPNRRENNGGGGEKKDEVENTTFVFLLSSFPRPPPPAPHNLFHLG